jgi:short-subunit dehydrogenase
VKPYRTFVPTGNASKSFVGLRILICGASGNLGGELAKQLAQDGVRLSLWGRNGEKLQEVASACHKQGAQVITRSIDLFDIEGALAALRDEDDYEPIDCIFLTSGSGETREVGRKLESPAQVTKLGLLNFVIPAALASEIGERMAIRGRGTIAIVSTAAAAHPLPFAAGYTSSKRGLSHFAEATRIALKPFGVSVTLVSPGFFAPADKDAHAYPRPGETTAALVATHMIKAVAQGRARLVTPWFFVFFDFLGLALPRWIRDRLLLKLPVP